jgi:sulfite reductase (ferredoxin)
MPDPSWKKALSDQMDPEWANEIDLFEGQIELRRQGKLDEKVFAETRLRRGVYGQRYDNGQRADGIAVRELPYEPKPTKGPDTIWDAPGMQRIKIPFGGVSPEQLETLAALSEEYSKAVLHVTTRQDFQLHYLHIEDTPNLMRRLAAVGLTTREACGNSVRNVTGCPMAGVCHTEAFDVSPHASALMRFLLGHPDAQDFGRKFKPAFSGCEQEACGLAQMHDAGFVARVVDGRRGFKVVVGGGLGAVPQQAKVLSEFTPEEEILPLIQAVARVFARLGEKKNRGRARIKFLVSKLGIDEFRRLVEEERSRLPHDDRWTAFLKDMPHTESEAAREAAALPPGERSQGFEAWYATNVRPQAQKDYSVVTINLPLGDITADQTRALAAIARNYVGDNLRTTVEQNMLLRFVSEADLPALYRDLEAVGLAASGAGTIVDVTSCPGTDTCKLGISASRGLARELRARLAAKSASLPQAISDLRIKISGCFNSCGQHHVADIGFYGNSRKIDSRTVPHFQVILGGQWTENAGSYGLAVGSVPSKAAPQVVEALTDAYAQGRQKGERFQDWIRRMGKPSVREIIKPFMKVPAHAENADFYTDWGDSREFTIGDLGVGECAGEVVSLFGIEVVKAESQAFDAQVAMDDGDYEGAGELAYAAMLSAARALVRTEYIDVTEDPDDIVAEFKTRFFDNQRFFDKYAGGKFGQYLLERHEKRDAAVDRDVAARYIEESLLFIEATHAVEKKIAPAPEASRARLVHLHRSQPAPAAGVQPETATPHRIAVKFFASPDPGKSVDLQSYIPVFHKFIQQGSVEGLLVDVADYAHVPEGPGIILVGHDVDYGMDLSGGRAGLLVTRKRYGNTALADVLRDTLRRALIAIKAIEAEGSTGQRFAGSQLSIRFLDRLNTPNDDEAFEAVKEEIAPVLRELAGDTDLEVTRTQADHQHAPLSVTVVAGEALDADASVQRLGGAADLEEERVGLPGQNGWEISVEDLKRLFEESADFVLVDVREPREYEICNLGGQLIPLTQLGRLGKKLIPLDELGGRLDELDKSAQIVVHCRAGGRGATAASAMRDAGFQNVRNLSGGILAWIDRVDPDLTRY